MYRSRWNSWNWRSNRGSRRRDGNSRLRRRCRYRLAGRRSWDIGICRCCRHLRGSGNDDRQGLLHLLLGEDGQGDAGHKEEQRQDRRRLRQETRRAGTAEYRLGGSGSERSAHLRTLALLEENEAGHGDRDHHMQNQNYCFHWTIRLVRLCGSADRDEIIGLQRCTAHKGAIDVRHGKK